MSEVVGNLEVNVTLDNPSHEHSQANKGDGRRETAQRVYNEVRVSSDESNDSILRRRKRFSHKAE
jgi:hypothetical protein